jgi:hypothetical protein
MWRVWGEKRNAYRTLLVKHESKKLHGRSRRRREDNIKLDLKELGFQGVDWVDLIRDRDKWQAVVNTVMKLVDFIKFGHHLIWHVRIVFERKTWTLHV